MSNSLLSKFPTYRRLMEKMRSRNAKQTNDNDDSFDFDIDGSGQTTISLPPQSSPTDTSNWDDRVFTTPDGREHIEDLGDTTTK